MSDDSAKGNAATLGTSLTPSPAPIGSPWLRVDVVEQGSNWPVPLAELRTVSGLKVVTDNAGTAVLDAPELFLPSRSSEANRKSRSKIGCDVVYLHVCSHGYECTRDAFGYAGVQVVPEPFGTVRIELRHTSIARRLGRWTGSGLFAESRKCGQRQEWRDAPLVGQDSVLMCRHGDLLFWVWGDTLLQHYPLGVFHAVAATSSLTPISRFEPPLEPRLEYFVRKVDDCDGGGGDNEDDQGPVRPYGVAELPGEGPTWLSGLISLRDAAGGPLRNVTLRSPTWLRLLPPL
eukprot:m.120590 g.120590  ORF g.120590 m.120590 type:complete len:289 (+) comp9581_c0_seq2:290-1156(+)